MASRSPARSGELVPLADRLRYMQVLRVVLACAAVVLGAVAPELVGLGMSQLAAATGAYLLVALVGEIAWRVARMRMLFGAMLIVDGLYLAWLSYATGGIASPIRYLILVHLIAVALLASYRTGLKLALWHSLLLFVAFHAEEAGFVEPLHTGVRLPGSDYEQLSAFVAAFWLVAIATAAFSAANERELRRRRVDVEALATMATRLEDAADSRAVGEIVVEDLVDAFGFARTALVAAPPDSQLSLLAARGCDRATADHPHPSALSSGVIQAALALRKTILVPELDPASDRYLTELFPHGKNFVVVPLPAEGRPVGVLVAEYGPRRRSTIERRVVSMTERFAAHAALALRSAWLLEQVRRMADTDGLTLIANRRAFDAALERELSRARRSGEAVSVVMVDLDNFKRLNDDHGHQVGDAVLRQVAETLVTECRDFDTVARYGGEEFGVVLPSCSPKEATEIAERLRAAVEAADTVVRVTASAGAASFPANARSGGELLQAADEALYASKRAGRNRVTRSRREPAAV